MFLFFLNWAANREYELNQFSDLSVYEFQHYFFLNLNDQRSVVYHSEGNQNRIQTEDLQSYFKS